MIASVVLSQLIDVCQSRLTAESRVLVRSEITVVETVAAQIVADTLSAVRASLEPVRTLPRVLCSDCTQHTVTGGLHRTTCRRTARRDVSVKVLSSK